MVMSSSPSISLRNSSTRAGGTSMSAKAPLRVGCCQKLRPRRSTTSDTRCGLEPTMTRKTLWPSYEALVGVGCGTAAAATASREERAASDFILTDLPKMSSTTMRLHFLSLFFYALGNALYTNSLRTQHCFTNGGS